MLPSPTELMNFSVIADCLNLSRASDKLGVSQPSLSMSIKKLEQTIGTHLFIRHKQGVTLTTAGEELLAQVKPLLQHWENTKIQVKNSHDQVRGRVTIGCRSVTPLYMQTFLKSFLSKHPLLEINFEFESPNKITERVVSSSIDIGIVANPQQHHDLVIYKIDEIEMSFWVGNVDSNTQNLHSGEAVVICEPNVPQVQALLKELEKSSIKIARIMTANNLEVVAQLTMQGLGVGILPTCIAKNTYSGNLEQIADMPTHSTDLCLIYRYENKSVLAVKTVIDALKNFSITWTE